MYEMNNKLGSNDLLQLWMQNQQPKTTLGADGLMGSLKGMNLNDALGGIQGLMGLYQGYQANQLGKKQYETNKAFGNANLVNTAKNYNTNLENMYAKALAAKQGTGVQMASLEDYLAKHKVSDQPIA